MSVLASWNANFTERVSQKGKAIGNVRPSVSLFVPTLLNRLTFEPCSFCVCTGHDPAILGLISQGHSPKSRVEDEFFVVNCSDQSDERVASWTGKSLLATPDSHDLLRTSLRGCHHDATRNMVPWNLSFNVK